MLYFINEVTRLVRKTATFHTLRRFETFCRQKYSEKIFGVNVRERQRFSSLLDTYLQVIADAEPVKYRAQ